MSDTDNSETQSKGPSIVSRREALKAGVATASSMIIPTSVGATPGSRDSNSEQIDRILNQALRLRERTGSQERFKQFLSNRTDYFQSNQTTFTPASQRSDGVSTQDWSESAISTDLTLTYYTDACTSDDPYALIDYYITVDSSYGRGESGPDQISIGWADHHYRYEQGSAYSDNNMVNLSLNEESLNGVDWEWKDGAACDGGCSTKNYYVGCKAQLLDTYQERGVEATYWDMYNSAEVCGVSFSSSGGVSFSFCNVGQSDQYGVQIQEDSDASIGCGP